MSYIYSQEQGEAYWQAISLDTQSSEQSNTNRTARKSFKPDRETECCHPSPSGQTLEHSTGDHGVDAWILSARASRANRSQSQVNSELVRIQEMDTPPPFESFGKFDQSGSCLRTYQVSLLEPTGTCTPYSDSFPKAGMIVDGTAYLRTPVVRHTNGIGSGSSEGRATFPTPTSFRGPSEGSVRKMRKLIEQGHITREEAAVMIDGDPFKKQGKIPEHFPTPNAADNRPRGNPSDPSIQRRHRIGKQVSLSQSFEGSLNPEWVELLMGWTKGWTSLEPLPSGVMEEWLDTENYWQHDWESNTTRTGKKKNSTSRLRAIGNGQVPTCAAKAWKLLV